MPISLDVAHTPKHFDQILALQRQNHLENVAPADLASRGFVFARHDRALLETFAAKLPQVIALADGQVIGYTLAMPPSMRDALPELVAMFDQFERMHHQGRPITDYRYMVGGQVCVAQQARGRGLAGRLYQECRRRLPDGYELCVTEISERNPVSLRAHLKVGFEVVGSYTDDSHQWTVVAWALQGVD